MQTDLVSGVLVDHLLAHLAPPARLLVALFLCLHSLIHGRLEPGRLRAIELQLRCTQPARRGATSCMSVRRRGATATARLPPQSRSPRPAEDRRILLADSGATPTGTRRRISTPVHQIGLLLSVVLAAWRPPIQHEGQRPKLTPPHGDPVAVELTSAIHGGALTRSGTSSL